MRYGRTVTIPVTMYKKQRDKVQALADQKHEGNRSRAVREMIDAFEMEADDASSQ